MFVLVTYDVATSSEGGAARLRRVARACLDYGQRVQNSVFECQLEPGQFVQLKAKLMSLIDPQRDSLRFYYFGNEWRRRVMHVGAKPSYDPDGPLIV